MTKSGNMSIRSIKWIGLNTEHFSLHQILYYNHITIWIAQTMCAPFLFEQFEHRRSLVAERETNSVRLRRRFSRSGAQIAHLRRGAGTARNGNGNPTQPDKKRKLTSDHIMHNWIYVAAVGRRPHFITSCSGVERFACGRAILQRLRNRTMSDGKKHYPWNQFLRQVICIFTRYEFIYKKTTSTNDQ